MDAEKWVFLPLGHVDVPLNGESLEHEFATAGRGPP